MPTISKTTGKHLYINLLNFKDKEEQEKWYDIINNLIEKEPQERLEAAFENNKKSHTERLSF